MNISKLLDQMDEAVRAHKRGELLLGLRIRLWDAMNKEFRKEAAFRRNVLAFLVAQDAYSTWERGRLVSAIPPERLDEYYGYPRRAMDEYSRFLKGKSNRKNLQSITAPLADCLDYWLGKPHGPMQLAQIIIQNVQIRILGFDDQIYKDQGLYDMAGDDAAYLDITDDSLGEREWCESHFFAAMAAAEKSKKKVAARREFWHRWLAETVPSVLAPLPDVRGLLASWQVSGPPTVVEPRGQRQEIPRASAEQALRQHLQALALTPSEQLKLYVGACQICGLAGTVRQWSEHSSMSSVIRKQTASRRRLLSRIQQLADDVSQDSEVDCYDYEFTRQDLRWKEIRSLARELLDDFGWPQRRPPKRGSFLFGTPARDATSS